jgi:hypothetical protein
MNFKSMLFYDIKPLMEAALKYQRITIWIGELAIFKQAF